MTRWIDFDVLVFAMILSTLPPRLPISDAFDRSRTEIVDDSRYADQREHMVGWFRSQVTRGGGSYTRNNPNTSARATYNRLLNAASLLWIAEALGVDGRVVRAAADEARAEPEYRRRSAIVRRHIPWDQVAARAAGHKRPSR